MWKIRRTNIYFWLSILISILSISSLFISQCMFMVLFSGMVSDEFYNIVYPLNVSLSLSNTLFIRVCPIMIIPAIILFAIKKITLLEWLINVFLNIITPFLIIYIIVAVNGGV